MTGRFVQDGESQPLMLDVHDLLVASIMPLSSRIHQLNFAVNIDGKVEIAEWDSGNKQLFRSWETEFNYFEISKLRTLIHNLGENAVRAEILAGSWQDEDYECEDRSLLRFHHGNAEVFAVLPNKQFFVDHGISTQNRNSFSGIYGDIIAMLWRLAIGEASQRP